MQTIWKVNPLNAFTKEVSYKTKRGTRACRKFVDLWNGNVVSFPELGSWHDFDIKDTV